jgi:ABC-type uncharacterized transport system substrate-binding protein
MGFLVYATFVYSFTINYAQYQHAQYGRLLIILYDTSFFFYVEWGKGEEASQESFPDE